MVPFVLEAPGSSANCIFVANTSALLRFTTIEVPSTTVLEQGPPIRRSLPIIEHSLEDFRTLPMMSSDFGKQSMKLSQ